MNRISYQLLKFGIMLLLFIGCMSAFYIAGFYYPPLYLLFAAMFAGFGIFDWRKHRKKSAAE